MEVNKYLKNRLESCSHYELTDADKEYLEKRGINDFIYQKLTSKKFRKWQIDESSEAWVKKAIKINIDKNEPIKFVFPFGGYKLWRLPATPEVDWAEFFTISYYTNYLAPILKVYESGAELIFSSDDYIVERMNNVSKEDTDAYFNSFKKLTGKFSKYFPVNLKIDIVRLCDEFQDKSKFENFEKELAENVKHFSDEYNNQDPVKAEKMYKSSELNIKMDGLEKWCDLSEEEQKEKLKMGVIYHHAYCGLTDRKIYDRAEDKIVLFTTQISNSIAIGTTKASITKFWTGVGVLEKHGSDFKDRILSPQQLIDLDMSKVEVVLSDLISLKNFKDIKVLNIG